jgi:hypothetical protein
LPYRHASCSGRLVDGATEVYMMVLARFMRQEGPGFLEPGKGDGAAGRRGVGKGGRGVAVYAKRPIRRGYADAHVENSARRGLPRPTGNFNIHRAAAISL